MSSLHSVSGDLLTARDVARCLSISERTVWRWTALGMLPAPVRLRPRSTRWRTADLQRWLDDLGTRGRSDGKAPLAGVNP